MACVLSMTLNCSYPITLHLMAKSLFNFDKTIAGFNITENGVKSFTKSISLGPIQLTFNMRESGLHASVALPGTGLSKRNIKVL